MIVKLKNDEKSLAKIENDDIELISQLDAVLISR